MSQAVLKKIERIDRKLDELREFIGDVFLTSDEYTLLGEVDETVKKKNSARDDPSHQTTE